MKDKVDLCCWGYFFYVVGHGIPQQQFDYIESMAGELFALPEEEKKKISIEESSNHRGWGREWKDRTSMRRKKYEKHERRERSAGLGVWETERCRD